MTLDPITKLVPKERLIDAYAYAEEIRQSLRCSEGGPCTELGPNNIAGRTRVFIYDPNDAIFSKV